MDPCISWFQPEQEGPAKRLWLRIWQTQQDFENMNVKESDNDIETLNNVINAQNQTNANVINGKNDKSSSFLPRRRKVENRASTRGMFHQPDQVVGEFGGCPWRKDAYNYGKGVIG